MNFEDAVEYVLQWEGSEYVDDPDDKGGGTKFGISKRQFPAVDIQNLTREEAIELYRVRYWEPNADLLSFCDDSRVEARLFIYDIFDCLVNTGRRTTVLLLQRAYNANFSYDLEEDGEWGPLSDRALSYCLNTVYADPVRVAFKCERASYYRVLAAKDPSQEKFLAGWLRRAYA